MIPAMLGIVVAALLIPTGAVNAQNYPWCADRGDGATNCGFASYEQCRMKFLNCFRNPMYVPPGGEPRSQRRPR
jgi:hypothetical protein